MLPSEALGRQFELPDALLPGAAADADVEVISRHAVQIGNIGLLLPFDEVSELIERDGVCRLPNTSTWFSGITSVRGNMIPVFDLHELFDIACDRRRRRLIVVGENERAVALWADDFPQIVTLGEDSLMSSEPPIPALIRDHAREYYLRDDQIWVDCDIEGLVTTLGKMI